MSSTAKSSIKGSGNKGKSKASKPVSRSKRAGLQFPVGRIDRFLKKGKYADQISSGAPIFLAAALEYLACEVLELAGDKAKDNKKNRITPRYISLAVEHDEELSKLLAGVTIPGSGGVPKIHNDVLPKNNAD